ncbi:MAG: DUF7350 domain-containing protein [Halanaeroarchaeum sp.]
MNRRSFLGAAGALASTSLAGCTDLLQWQSPYAPPIAEDRPDAVYQPTHVEAMEMIGMQQTGPYGCALAYTYPHRFWLVTGTRTERVSITSEDSIHLMAVVWDRETGLVLPDASPAVDVTVAGESVTSLNPWTMLSQPMGTHFGDNVTLPSEGSYTFDVAISPPSLPRYGSIPAGPEGGTNCSFDFEYSVADRDALEITNFPEKQGTPGAVPTMEMDMLPASTVPRAAALPGRQIGTKTSGDADLVLTAIDDASPFGGDTDQTYLVVSPRTPYNRYGLPFTSLAATIDRDGETVFDGSLSAGLHPDLATHYGAVVDSLESGDDLSIVVEAPPQLSRHEGYETAFIEMPDVQLSV